ncbi:MAG TPA: phosphodiester glycosidase family protein [Gaiellaceae bacterium]
MLHKVLIAVALAGLTALPAAASPGGRLGATKIITQSLLMPGVSYQRQVEYTPHGPVVLDVVTAPRPDGSLYSLGTALSNNAIVGTEKLTDIEKTASASATVVGVNGDFFAANPGAPTGIVMRGGALDFAPALKRSSLGIGADGMLTVASVGFDGTWRGTDQRRQLDLNKPPIAGHTTLYTSAWGPATPPESGVVEDVLGSLPPTIPNSVLTGVVTQASTDGAIPIPPGGAVLVARGNQAPHLSAEAPVGTTVEIRLTLTPNWHAMSGAIGGGPALVADGRPVFRANESFGDPVLNARTARSAVGQLSDGRILLVAAEGGSLGYSAGMTNYELAVALARLGAVNAMSLGTGASSAMAFDGSLLTSPSGGGEQAVSDALLISYTGVYAAPPSTAVLSPNGDNVDDAQTFTYRLVRASTVTATLTGPDRSTRVLVQDGEQPGVHTLQWDGRTTTGDPAAEGSWKLSVAAVDDRGVASTAERLFALNDTLGALQASPAAAQLRPKARGVVAATFDLARAARVTVTVEKRSGIVIATVLDDQLEPGAQKVLWNGHTWTGSLAFTGEYQLHVVATNSIGTVSLVAPFTARRP